MARKQEEGNQGREARQLTTSSIGDQRPARPSPEWRLPAALAVAAAITLYGLLPDRLLAAPRLIVPVIGCLLFLPLLVANPKRMTRETSLLRALAVSLVALLIVANGISLGLLIHALLFSNIKQGRMLLLGALQVWATNIVAFGLAYWELDRGGAVARSNRRREDLPPADFRFSQDEDADAAEEVAARSSRRSGWMPQFIDYLYISITNSTAFSPTDTMPLTPRTKVLMSVQAIAAIVINVLVIARAVSVLQ